MWSFFFLLLFPLPSSFKDSISLVSHSPHHLSSSTSLISVNQILHSSNELGIKGMQLGRDMVTRLGNISVHLSSVYLFICLLYKCKFPLFMLGHSKAVRDICFNNSGTQFLSAAYDRYLKLWDSETGRL